MRSLPWILCAVLSPAVLSLSPVAADDEGAAADTVHSAPALDSEALSHFVDDFFAREMNELGVPGAAFAMVVRRDEATAEIVLLRGFGHADLDAGVEMDPRRTVVRVGSVSKPVTALAALQLVERGELDLDGDIAEVLGDLVPATFEDPVTLFHLLSQTAGFGERLFGQHAREAQGHLELRPFLERHLTRRVRPPGLVVNYNDHHTSLAGLLVESATRSRFPEAAHELVFAPLGMASSTFEQIELPGDLESRLALAYRNGPRELQRDYVHTTPAAGLFTTAEDMGRFVAALLTEGHDLERRAAVYPAAVRAMKTTQFRHGPEMDGRGFGLAEGTSHGYRTLYKDGQCSGFTARIVLVPELGIGWFSVQNLSIFGRAGAIGPVNGMHRRLASQLLEELFTAGPGRVRTEPAAAPLDPRAARALAGTYRETMDPTEGWEGLLLANEVVVEAHDDGTLRFLGLEPWRPSASPEAPGSFFYEDESTTALARFVESEATSQSWVTFRAGAWERVPWYKTARFRYAALAISLGLLLTAPPAFAWLRRRRGRLLPSGALPLSAAAGLWLLFALGLGAAMLVTDVQTLYSGKTPLLRVVFLLPPAAFAVTVLALARLALTSRRGVPSRARNLATSYWVLVGAASLLAFTVVAIS